MWRKVIDGEEVVAPRVEGPGFSLGPDDTVGADGWEPVPDDYAAGQAVIAVPLAALAGLKTEIAKATTIAAVRKAITGFVSDCTTDV